MKQATVKLPSGTYAIQKVPKGIPDNEDFGYEAGSTYNHIYTGKGEYEFHSQPYGMLPPVKTGLKTSDWQLLGADPTNLTEEEAGEIVGKVMEVGGVYHWYTDYQNPTKRVKAYASASLDSLAQSLGVSKPYVILKNIEK